MLQHIIAKDGVKVAVRPDLGGRIDQITDLETGKEWLWHPQKYGGEPRRLPIGASFDEHWSGGWDEVFPNDAACAFRGRSLADHGELWSQRWRIAAESPSSLTLAYSCQSVPVAVEKSVTAVEKGVEVRYLLENRSVNALPFLFKLHPALAVEAGDEILLPPCRIEPVDTGFSTIIGRPEKTSFPFAFDREGGKVRVNAAPGREADQQEFFYATDLDGAWCALRNNRTGKRLEFTFDGSEIPYVWVFSSYGKWKGHYVVILEPCTNVPYDLETAYRNGTCAVLGGKKSKELKVSVRLS